MIIDKRIYPAPLVLELIKPNEYTTGRTKFDGDPVRVSSLRLKCFKKNGLVCVSCGLKGTYFRKCRHSDQDVFHLNLFAIDDQGEEVLMTADHIIPKSKGGPHHLDNLQTMCVRCNGKKADQMPTEFGMKVLKAIRGVDVQP